MILAWVHDDRRHNVIEEKSEKAMSRAEIPKSDRLVGGGGNDTRHARRAGTHVEVRHGQRMSGPRV